MCIDARCVKFQDYLKWLLVYICIGEEKKLDEKLKETMEALTITWEAFNKLHMAPKNESTNAKAEQELEVTAAKNRLREAKVKMGSAIGACYNLFHQLLADKPQVQWDHIVAEVYNKDPWTGLDGVN